MAIAARDNEDRIEQLILLTDKLTSIIRTEAELLRARRTRDISAFEGEKTRLAKLYSSEMSRLKNDRALTNGVRRGLIDALKERTQFFQAALSEHAAILNRMKTVTERMVRSIALEVEKTRTTRSGYGPGAVRAPSRGVPFALNQTA